MTENNDDKSSNSERENSNQNNKDSIKRNISNDLEKIKESEEGEEIMLSTNPVEEIKNLREKISSLESKNSKLQKKVKELTKENIRTDTKLKRISFVGIRKNFSFENKTDSFQMTHLIKEKNDLQEINEKMLNILTEKEIYPELICNDAKPEKIFSELENYLNDENSKHEINTRLNDAKKLMGFENAAEFWAQCVINL